MGYASIRECHTDAIKGCSSFYLFAHSRDLRHVDENYDPLVGPNQSSEFIRLV
jgi:hypothetical protein